MKYMDDSDDSDLDSSAGPVRPKTFIPAKIEQIRLAQSFRIPGRDQEIEEENKTKRIEQDRKTVEPRVGLRKDFDDDENSEREDHEILSRKTKPEVNKYQGLRPRPKPYKRRVTSSFSSHSDDDSEIVQRGSKDKPIRELSVKPRGKNQPIRESEVLSSDDDDPRARNLADFKSAGEVVRAEESSSDQGGSVSRDFSQNIQQLMEKKAQEAIPLESSLSIRPSENKREFTPIFNSKPIGFQSRESMVERFPSSDSDVEPFEEAKTLKKKEDEVSHPPEQVKLPPSIECQISQQESAYSSTYAPTYSEGFSAKTGSNVFNSYSAPEVESSNSYQLAHLVRDYRSGDGFIVLLCGHVLNESDIKIYEIQPGEVKCPLCGCISKLGNLAFKKVTSEKLLRNLVKIKNFSKKQNQCQMEDCKGGKNPKYAYIIGKNKVICKDCIFKREGQKLNWIILEHLPEKLEKQFQKHQIFFLSKAQALAEQREKIRTKYEDLKLFSQRQNKVLSNRMLELQGRIDRNMNQELERLEEGKQNYLNELQYAQTNLNHHLEDLRNRRDELNGILRELKRLPREIPSQVKVGLDVEKKIQKCGSLLQGELEETQVYSAPLLKENLNYEGLVDYEVERQHIKVDGGIWNTYIGDLDTTAKTYETFKKNQREIDASYQ